MTAFGTFQGSAFDPSLMGYLRATFCTNAMASWTICTSLIAAPAPAAALAKALAKALTSARIPSFSRSFHKYWIFMLWIYSKKFRQYRVSCLSLFLIFLLHLGEPVFKT